MNDPKAAFPPRLMGAELPGSNGEWHASNTIVPPDYCAFEFLSKLEHAATIADLEQRLKRAVEVLGWYANRDNHEAAFTHDGCQTNGNADAGERARNALEALTKIRAALKPSGEGSDGK